MHRVFSQIVSSVGSTGPFTHAFRSQNIGFILSSEDFRWISTLPIVVTKRVKRV
jgi:hypothetical protein